MNPTGDPKQREFFAAVVGLGLHVLRDLYQEVISKVEDKEKRLAFEKEYEEKVLPQAEKSYKRLMFGGKTYAMYFKRVDETYKLSEQMAKIPTEGMSVENKNLLTMERDVTICSPMNFQKILATHGKGFFNRLVNALPKDHYTRDIPLKLDEDDTVYYIYPDSKIRFGLWIDEVTGSDFDP